jgi:hypothetical protein
MSRSLRGVTSEQSPRRRVLPSPQSARFQHQLSCLRRLAVADAQFEASGKEGLYIGPAGGT